MKSIHKGFKMPDALKIGQRFQLAFEDPSLSRTTHQGRLQDLSPDYLCIDAPDELRPPRGTPVTVSSILENSDEYSFSSEILGRRRLHGRLPVLLVKPPNQLEHKYRRTAFRVSVTLKALVEWEDAKQPGIPIKKPGVLTNLSGGGAQLFLRYLPSVEILNIALSAPDAFIEEWAKRQLNGRPSNRPLICKDPFEQACGKIREQLGDLKARIVHSKTHAEDGRGPIYALSVAFLKPHEGCYRLVRYLESDRLHTSFNFEFLISA